MAKVTGIGAVFFKSTNDPKNLAEWYSQHLGIQLEPCGGAILKWTDDTPRTAAPHRVACRRPEHGMVRPQPLQLHDQLPHRNMAEILAKLQRNGVQIWKGAESHENGKFAWNLDRDGNKVELWEPIAVG